MMNQQISDIETVISGLLVSLDDIPTNTAYEPYIQKVYGKLEESRDMLNDILEKSNSTVQADIANARGRE